MKLQMKRKTVMSAVSTLSGLVLLLGYSNCSPVTFAPSELASKGTEGGLGDPGIDTGTEVVTDEPDGSRTYSATLNFDPIQKAKPLDLIWVIDNSGSMGEEANHVRKNFKSFMSFVESRTDLKIALISKPGTSGPTVTLESTGSQHIQLNQNVGSWNGPELLANALCPKSSSPGSACSKVKTHSYRSHLRSFLRADAKKAIVFVTDDNSQMSPNDFRAVLKETMPGHNPTVFGFVSLGQAQSKCQAAEGKAYKDLALNSSGEIYNICDKDWNPKFAKLAESVVLLSNTSFPVPDEVRNSQVESVYLDGVKLPASLYRVTKDGLVLDPSITPASGSGTILINYVL